jgi:hypothetical protein
VKESLKLQVFELGDDGAQQAVTDARVVLGKRELLQDSRFPHDDLLQTHRHLSDGFYGTFVGDPAAEPAEGEWLLVVTTPDKKKSPVVQRLTLKLSGEALLALPGWGKGAGALSQQAATVSIVNAGTKVKGDAAKHTTVNVLLFPRQEIVALSGHDDHGNTEYALMAEGRRNLLSKRKILNPGAISRILHGNRRAVIVSVKSASPESNSWVELDVRVDHPLDAETEKERGRKTADRELTILFFYGQLQEIGKDFPGTVVEAGVFSHAWTMGPIIWNTSDLTNSVTERAPLDTDGRQKDWLPAGKSSVTMTGETTEGPIMRGFPDLAKAFAPDASLRIWGCSHMLNVIRAGVVAVQQPASTPRDRFFLVSPLVMPSGRGYFGGGEENTTLDHLKRRVAQFFAGNKYARALESDDLRGSLNYPGAASRFLSGVKVFGAPPGMGSLYGRHGGERTFYIDDEARPKNAKDDDPRGENFALFRWYRREFEGFFKEDALHYVDYSELRKAPLPDPGFRTERYATFLDVEQRGSTQAEVDQNQPALVLRLPSGLEVHRQVRRPVNPMTIFRRPRAFSFDGVEGHLYVIRQHSLLVVERRGPNTIVVVAADPTTDSAAFVGADGRTRWLTAPAGKEPFVLAAAPLPVTIPTYFAGTQWREPHQAGPPITDGVIEAVAPRCFW